MSTIQEYFQQAQLAEAAYAHFDLFGANISAALRDERNGMNFSAAQATAFADQWQVIDHIPDTQAGFSATIFQNRQTLAYHLAIRGSTDMADFTQDGTLIARDGIAIHQIVDLYNFWHRATTPSGLNSYRAARVVLYDGFASTSVPIGISPYRIKFCDSSELADVSLRRPSGPISLGGGALTVSGHSLGGHLTMAFTRLFPALATDATAINGLGFKSNHPTVDSLFSILGGAGANAFNPNKIQNVYGIAGPEFAAMANWILQQPGGFNGIYIESASPLSPIFGGHGASQMTDSAALYSLYAKLAPSLTLTQITTLLKSASPVAERSLEYALDALRTLLQGKAVTDSDPTKFDSTAARESLYKNLKALQDSPAYKSLSGSAALRLTAAEIADSLAQKAKTDFGWFLAVQELLPIAIEGGGSVLIGANPDLHARWSADRAKRTDGSSDLEFTDTYLNDRSTMLAWWMLGNAEDRGYGPTTGGENWQFLDVASSKAAYALSTGSAIDAARAAAGAPARLAAMFDEEMKHSRGHRVGFGGDGGDQITGGGLDDRLYGMAGKDVLQGRGGNDHVEGGKDDDVLIGGKGSDLLNGGQGYDTYAWSAGDGDDTLIDADRKGRIVINGLETTVLIKSGAAWTSPDGKVTLTQSDTWKLNIDGGGSLDLGTEFNDGHYGIFRTEMATGGTILRGDLKPQDTDPDQSGDQIGYDDLGNVKVTTTEAPGREDRLFGSATADTLLGLAGNDRLNGLGGNDLMEGGSGSDILIGDAGGDTLYGSSGPAGSTPLATALASGETDTNQDARGDWVDGGTGDDILVGTAAKDILTGGSGHDILIGGAGEDLLLGDVAMVNAGAEWNVNRTITDRYTYHIAASSVTGSASVGDADVLYGGKGEDWLFGGAGDDLLDGGTQADVLFGQAGNDIVLGGGGNDVVVGDDSLISEELHGADWLDGGEGNDELHGLAGDDVLIGGKGEDTLVGGKGRDIYIFNKGDGIERIQDDDKGVEKSILVFGEGVDKDEVKLRTGSLLLDLGNGDAIHIDNWDQANPLANQTFASFQFADGSSLSWEGLLARGFDLDGTEGDDEIFGTGVDDRIDGRGGNDTIWGGKGNDIITGGSGTDRIDGGLGDDTYVFSAGDGTTLDGTAIGVAETLVDEGGLDTVRFAADVDAANLTLKANADGALAIDYAPQEVPLEDHAAGQPIDRLLIVDGQDGRIEKFEFAQGAQAPARSLDYAQLVGEYGSGLFSGTDIDGRRHLAGGKTNDLLLVSESNALVCGGRGNDALLVYGSTNTLHYRVGDGGDKLQTEFAVNAGNVLKLSGVTAANICVPQSCTADMARQRYVDAQQAAINENSWRMMA